MDSSIKNTEYRTIADRAEDRFVTKKSEFIGYIAPVTTDTQATDFINEIKAMHRKATHNCYAYILRENNTARHSDDGEPSGTAGVPMHEVLAKEGLVDVCCVVTRYFGGILLGAGGLVRAYSNGVSVAVAAAKIKVMAVAMRLHINVEYHLYGRIGTILADPQYNLKIEDELFTDKVDIRLYIRTELAPVLKDKLIDTCNGNINVEFLGEEYFDFA